MLSPGRDHLLHGLRDAVHGLMKMLRHAFQVVNLGWCSIRTRPTELSLANYSIIICLQLRLQLVDLLLLN